MIGFIRNEHRAFSKWTDEQIGSLIVSCLKDNICIINEDASNKIDGIVLARIYADKIIHIEVCIAKKKPVLRAFLDIYRDRYSNYIIEGHRRFNLLVRYNTKRLVDLLYA